MLALGSGAAALAMANLRSDLDRGGLPQRARQRAPAEGDLEGIVLAAARLREGRIRGRRNGRVVDRLAAQRLFGRPRPPRHRRDAAERDARIRDGPVADVERQGGGGHRELVGGAITHLEMVRLPSVPAISTPASSAISAWAKSPG